MLRDLKEAIRALGRTPGTTAIVVATMAIVIGANATIFSALNGVVMRPLAYDAPEELVMLWENNLQQGQEQVRTSAAGWFPEGRLGTSPSTVVVVIPVSYSSTMMRPVIR